MPPTHFLTRNIAGAPLLRQPSYAVSVPSSLGKDSSVSRSSLCCISFIHSRRFLCLIRGAPVLIEDFGDLL